MVISPIRSPRITPHSYTLTALLDEILPAMPDRSVLAVTSKVVSLCEGRVVPGDEASKDELAIQAAGMYLPRSASRWGVMLTITNNTLVSSAGIDDSNAGDVHVLWPHDPQAAANEVRRYLKERFGHAHIGVVITDSASRPLRLGASGIALGFSGFRPLHNYIGSPDLFGRPFKVSQADIAGGLAAAAVLAMGEGAESTPLALISDIPNIEYVDRDPDDAELAGFRIPLHEDLFAPLLQAGQWQKGGNNENRSI